MSSGNILSTSNCMLHTNLLTFYLVRLAIRGFGYTLKRKSSLAMVIVIGRQHEVFLAEINTVIPSILHPGFETV